MQHTYVLRTLYLAQAITSLKRNRCLNFRWPSANSTMKEFFTNLLWALSADCNIQNQKHSPDAIPGGLTKLLWVNFLDTCVNIRIGKEVKYNSHLEKTLYEFKIPINYIVSLDRYSWLGSWTHTINKITYRKHCLCLNHIKFIQKVLSHLQGIGQCFVIWVWFWSVSQEILTDSQNLLELESYLSRSKYYNTYMQNQCIFLHSCNWFM